MNSQQLGRLEALHLRDVWKSESENFTPWLARGENLQLLGNTLGIELQLEAQEKDVGQYRADIVCKDTVDDSWVLIENQLTATNHTHLGQILTYAAGLNAVTIIWIAERFTDEHRAAIDWLNEISSENVRFFGIEIEIWRIGESSPAPRFNLVARPNEWTKGGRTSRIRELELTESKKLQLEFWRGFREYLIENSKVLKPTKPLPQHWMNIALGRSGFKLVAIAAVYSSESGDYGKHEIRAEMEINDRQYSKQYYELLVREKQQIEEDFGDLLTWYNPSDAKVCRIFALKTIKHLSAGNRDDLYLWLMTKLEILHKVFFDRVRKLDIRNVELV